MREGRKWKVLKVVTLVSIFAVVAALVAHALWNWLMPQIFGLPSLSVWQVLGLMLLSRLLLGGFRRGGPRRWPGGRGFDMSSLSPEEKEAFRERLERHHSRCGRGFFRREQSNA